MFFFDIADNIAWIDLNVRAWSVGRRTGSDSDFLFDINIANWPLYSSRGSELSAESRELSYLTCHLQLCPRADS